jgi:mannose-6-phosphate isomerase-like protein (cupin superfamily)
LLPSATGCSPSSATSPTPARGHRHDRGLDRRSRRRRGGPVRPDPDAHPGRRQPHRPRLGIGEITIAAHIDGPVQHRHAEDDEGFYVVSGVATFTVGDTSYDAPVGTLVMVPPGAPHTFANHEDEPAVLLNTFTPDLYVQYFRDLHDMIAAGEPFAPEASIAVMAKYATTPATGYSR